MRVLFISDVDQDFGAPKSLYYLIRDLKDNYDVEPIVITLSNGKLNKALSEIDVINYNIGNIRSLFFLSSSFKKYISIILSPILILILNRQMKKAIKSVEKHVDMNLVDVVHTNVSVNSIGINISKKWNKPHIWHMRENLIGNTKYGIFHQKSYVQLINSSHNNVIYISDFMRREWSKLDISVDSSYVVYNGITDVSSKKIYFDNSDKVSFVVVGSLLRTKGQYQVLEAINLLTDQQKEKVHLTIIGTGDKQYTLYLQSLVDKYDLSSIVTFNGYDPNISEHLKNFDVGLMTSKAEAFGRTTVEYMMAGLPVIASNTGANPELIKHNENGLLYEWDDFTSLKNQIMSFVVQPQKIQTMGEFAKKDSNIRFSAKSNADKVYKIIEQVTK